MKNSMYLLLHKLTEPNLIGESWKCPICTYKYPKVMVWQDKEETEWIECCTEGCGNWVHLDCEDVFSGRKQDRNKIYQEDYKYMCPMCRDPKFMNNLSIKCGLYKV